MAILKLLNIREAQITTTESLSHSKKPSGNPTVNAGEDVGEEEPYPRLMRVKINTAMKVISLEVPQKIKLFTPEHTHTQRTTDPIIDRSAALVY